MDDLARWMLRSIGRFRLRSHLGRKHWLVDAQNMPRVDALYREAMAVLDAPRRYPLYVVDDERINAATMEAGQPTLTLTSGAVGALTDDELLVVLGHELGHLLCDHVLYQYLSRLLLSMGARTRSPLILPGSIAALTALQTWRRASELSADRASLLVAQDPEIVQRLFGRLGEEIHTPEQLRERAEREREGLGWRERLQKGWQFVADAHPERHHRALEVSRWSESEEYRAALAGDYPRRSEDPPTGSDRVEGAVNGLGRWALDRRQAAFTGLVNLRRGG